VQVEVYTSLERQIVKHSERSEVKSGSRPVNAVASVVVERRQRSNTIEQHHPSSRSMTAGFRSGPAECVPNSSKAPGSTPQSVRIRSAESRRSAQKTKCNVSHSYSGFLHSPGTGAQAIHRPLWVFL